MLVTHYFFEPRTKSFVFAWVLTLRDSDIRGGGKNLIVAYGGTRNHLRIKIYDKGL